MRFDPGAFEPPQPLEIEPLTRYVVDDDGRDVRGMIDRAAWVAAGALTMTVLLVGDLVFGHLVSVWLSWHV